MIIYIKDEQRKERVSGNVNINHKETEMFKIAVPKIDELVLNRTNCKKKEIPTLSWSNALGVAAITTII